MKETVIAAAVAMLLAAAWVTDMRTQTIPNRLTFGFLGAGLVFHLAWGGREGLMFALFGFAAGFVPLLLLYAAKGLGAGDVKLFGAAGAWIGAHAVLQLMLYSILYAGAIGAALLVLRRPKWRRAAAGAWRRLAPAGWSRYVRWASSGNAFPFMAAVVPAAATIGAAAMGTH